MLRPERRPAMTVEELHALPVSVPLWPEAAAAFAVSRSSAYQQARAGTFPVPVRRVGSLWRVNRSDLLRALGMSASCCGQESA